MMRYTDWNRFRKSACQIRLPGIGAYKERKRQLRLETVNRGVARSAGVRLQPALACIALLPFLFLAFPCDGQTLPPDKKQAIGNVEKRSLFPQYGFSYVAPSGWSFVPGTWVGEFGEWSRKDEKTGSNACLVTLQAVPAPDNNLRQHAEELAKDFKGKISDTTQTLDGAKALVINGDGKWGYDKGRMLICIHDRECYELYVNAATSESLDLNLNAFASKWKWEKPSPAYASLGFRELRIPVSDETLQMKMPRTMGLIPLEGVSSEKYAIYDYRTHSIALLMDVTTQPTKGDANSATFREKFGTIIKSRVKLKTGVLWSRVSGRPGFYLSQLIGIPGKPSENPLEKTQVRYGLLSIPNGDVMQFTFALTGQGVEASKAFCDMIDKMCGSVEFGSSEAQKKTPE